MNFTRIICPKNMTGYALRATPSIREFHIFPLDNLRMNGEKQHMKRMTFSIAADHMATIKSSGEDILPLSGLSKSGAD